MAAWLASQSDLGRRSEFKRYLLSAAIEQNRRGYMIVPDIRVTELWQHYWEYANEHYPELEMQRPGPRSAKADWLVNPNNMSYNLYIKGSIPILDQ